MANGQLGAAVPAQRRVVTAECTDGELLERFAAAGEEAAFAELVRRHGPMVLGVCRRILSAEHDAEDAFQATFLVLARRARAIHKGEAVGSWLYGVAYRIAVRARSDAAKRRKHEGQVTTLPSQDPLEELTWRELRPVLDQELGRLPAKYRDPLVLCYLEGKTNAEAAEELGWTKGTVSGRLARARDLLRGRLARRGVALTSALLVLLLSKKTAVAAVPATLATSTVTAAVCGASAAVATGVLSGRAVAWAAAALAAWWRGRVMGLAAGILLLLGVTTLAASKLADPPPKGCHATVATERKVSDQVLLQGQWGLGTKQLSGKQPTTDDTFRAIFKGNQLTFVVNGQRETWDFVLDEADDVKAIDLIRNDTKERGVYRLQDGKLYLCLGAPSGERPTRRAFAREVGPGQILYELKPLPPDQSAGCH
jgi:RNA polymerase sigma-70 factor (ECF subfamily)